MEIYILRILFISILCLFIQRTCYQKITHTKTSLWLANIHTKIRKLLRKLIKGNEHQFWDGVVRQMITWVGRIVWIDLDNMPYYLNNRPQSGVQSFLAFWDNAYIKMVHHFSYKSSKTISFSKTLIFSRIDKIFSSNLP